jgi:hypothetical protein
VCLANTILGVLTMKYTINSVNQIGIADAGLLKKTDLVDWAILGYILDFTSHPKSFKLDGFVWFNYSHFLKEMPLLGLNGKGAVSNRISKLRKLHLIETIPDDEGRIYVKLTEFYHNTATFKVDDSIPTHPKSSKKITSPVHSNEHPVHSNEHPVHSNEHPVHSNEHPVHSNEHPVHSNEHITDNNNSTKEQKIKTDNNKQPQSSVNETNNGNVNDVVVVDFLNLKDVVVNPLDLGHIRLQGLNETEHAIALKKLTTLDEQQAQFLISSYKRTINGGDYESAMKVFNGLMKLASKGLLTDPKTTVVKIKNGQVVNPTAPTAQQAPTTARYESDDVRILRKMLESPKRNELIQKFSRNGQLVIGTYSYTQHELEQAGFPFNEVYIQTVPRSGTGTTSVGDLLGGQRNAPVKDEIQDKIKRYENEVAKALKIAEEETEEPARRNHFIERAQELQKMVDGMRQRQGGQY